MPTSNHLISMGGLEQKRFLEMSSHHLHTDRQTLPVKTDREGQPWHASQVCRQSEHVFQVHRQWVIGVLPDAKGGGDICFGSAVIV